MSLNFAEGQVLLINKPYMWTSFNVVGKLKSEFKHHPELKKIKIGHAGTLDPLATGLMIICTGKKTKEVSQLQALEKEYAATLKFGATTPSFDLETAIDQEYPYKHITEEMMQDCIVKFTGKIKQVPPAFSAKWVNGQRAYKKARKGKELEMREADIEIHKIKILEFKLPYVKILTVCGKGTYIRALVRDIGRTVNSGAHLVSLERTRIGNYCLSDALTVNELKNLF
ncbi:MAG: tRNA pseudouridine(55) synthase TruB [Bacteroidia bacterium]|nr:tRNA pseudouridine(55) synthase TruB [Bacteroidia bacterium]